MPWYERSSYRAISISTVALQVLKAKKQRVWCGIKRLTEQEEAKKVSRPKSPGTRSTVRPPTGPGASTSRVKFAAEIVQAST